MRHAGDEALQSLEDLLAELRLLPGLIEVKRGTFYRKSRAFLHFHEDETGLYADARLDAEGDFTRLPVSSPSEKEILVSKLRQALSL